MDEQPDFEAIAALPLAERLGLWIPEMERSASSLAEHAAGDGECLMAAKGTEQVAALLRDARERIAELEARPQQGEVERLREALRPFAAIHTGGRYRRKSVAVIEGMDFTVADVEEARAALGGKDEKDV